MNKILATLTLLVFANCVNAVAPRFATAKRGDTVRVQADRSKKALLGSDNMLLGSRETYRSSSTLNDQISILKHKIKDAHHQVERLHGQIHAWTKELAPLEVQAHHERASHPTEMSAHF